MPTGISITLTPHLLGKDGLSQLDTFAGSIVTSSRERQTWTAASLAFPEIQAQTAAPRITQRKLRQDATGDGTMSKSRWTRATKIRELYVSYFAYSLSRYGEQI